MKKILFIAIILAQLIGSLDGVLMDGKENISAIKKELKEENTDEPEILVRSATRIFIVAFLPSGTGNENHKMSDVAMDVSQESVAETGLLFIRHRCLRI